MRLGPYSVSPGHFRAGHGRCATSAHPRRSSTHAQGKAAERAPMSLSAWEQQALDSINNRLAGSDPELAAMLATFTQLTTGEEMPVAEEIAAGSRQANRRSVHRFYQRLDLQWAALSLWLLITIALISIALALTSGPTRGTCTGSWAATCISPVPAHSLPPVSRKTAASHTAQSAVSWRRSPPWPLTSGR